MARLKNTILGNMAFNSGRQGQAAMVDLSLQKAGQYGYQPHFESYVSNTGYTPKNVIAILIEAPRGYRYLPDQDKWIATLKALIETQSKNITGLRRGVNVEFADRPVGGAGHMQSDPTNVTEEQSTPTHVWDERYGAAIQLFWSQHIRYLIMDPTTKQPGLMNLDGVDQPEDALADMFSFTTLYIEPDPLRRGVVWAWLGTNMQPTTSGILESQMDPTTGQPVPEISIEFKGMYVSNAGVRQFAQTILDNFNYVNAGPMQRPAFVDAINAEVKDANNGYAEALAEASQSGNGA